MENEIVLRQTQVLTCEIPFLKHILTPHNRYEKGYIATYIVLSESSGFPHPSRPGGTFLKAPGSYFKRLKGTRIFCMIYLIKVQKAPGTVPKFPVVLPGLIYNRSGSLMQH